MANAMNMGLNLKDLEKKAYKSVHQDGFWDLFMGMILLGFALGDALSVLGMPELSRMIVYSAIIAVGVDDGA